MNRSAYFTTGVAIRALANLSKANVGIHGTENIPREPTIFVVNHFTRTETLLLPYHIYQLTGTPVFSLASDELFRGALTRIFDMIGVISTRDPNRDRIIIKGLLTGSENWIIFPEGRMVKTKKIIGKGEFLIHHEGGTHKPHTGAASLALRAEYFRKHLLMRKRDEPLNVNSFLQTFGIDDIDEIGDKKTAIVPVNLTYYPLRAKENIATYFANRLMKEVPDRVLEELMTEGTMLLQGVDLDIHFGPPIFLDDSLDTPLVQRELQRPVGKDPNFSDAFGDYLRKEAYRIMQQYMRAIYDMTTINHEHLFASMLMRHPFREIEEMDLRRRVYLAIHSISRKEEIDCNIHKSLKEEQVQLLSDDRFKKVENFLQLALEKEVITRKNGRLVKQRRDIDDILTSSLGRIDSPLDVMVNEAEPLKNLQRLIRKLSWYPSFLIKARVARLLLREEEDAYRKDCRIIGDRTVTSGGPFLLRGKRNKAGVVLVHSYLSVPEEVKELAAYLNGQGYWVYAPRLAGHGTTPADLAGRSYREWQLCVEKGYAIMSTICTSVVLGGVSIGGSLALDLAARLQKQSNLSGVFAVGPPLRLADYTTSFMPSMDVWDRILARLKRNDLEEDFFHFESENRFANYDRNPIAGVKNVGTFLDRLKDSYPHVSQPCLILHAMEDPVVSSEGSRTIYEEIRSEKKEYVLLSSDKHIIIRGEGSDRAHHLIGSFLDDLDN